MDKYTHTRLAEQRLNKGKQNQNNRRKKHEIKQTAFRNLSLLLVASKLASKQARLLVSGFRKLKKERK